MSHIPALCTAALVTALFGSSLAAQKDKQATRTVLGLPGLSGERTITVVVDVDGRELQIRIKSSKVKAYVDGNRVASKNIEIKGTEHRIRDDAGRQLAMIEIDDGTLSLQPDLTSAKRARLGLTLGYIDEALARHLDLDPEDVRIVQQVVKGAAAEKADIQKHDVLLRVDGKAPVTANIVRKILAKKAPGDKLRLRILRRGRERDVEATLDQEPILETLDFVVQNSLVRFQDVTLVDPTPVVGETRLLLSLDNAVTLPLLNEGPAARQRDYKKLEASLEDLQKEIAELRKHSERLEKLLQELTRRRDR